MAAFKVAIHRRLSSKLDPFSEKTSHTGGHATRSTPLVICLVAVTGTGPGYPLGPCLRRLNRKTGNLKSRQAQRRGERHAAPAFPPLYPAPPRPTPPPPYYPSPARPPLPPPPPRTQKKYFPHFMFFLMIVWQLFRRGKPPHQGEGRNITCHIPRIELELCMYQASGRGHTVGGYLTTTLVDVLF